ncbi:putative immunity protein [Cellulosimicrobium funkei]|uniref:putative immunity protein n=1 Tax=Cellulosimicrobium funkei TaxID=264251 RepID=UPI00368DA81D
MPILPTERDPRLVTIRRGGTLTDEHHHQIARWAVDCAEHVLPIFERARPDDTRPRDALDVARAWIRGDVPMKTAHTTAFIANAAGRDQAAPVKYAALAAGQAVAVAHVAAHGLGAAAAAADAAARGEDAEAARLAERDRQRDRIPAGLRELVLDDQRRRSAISWHVFDD